MTMKTLILALSLIATVAATGVPASAAFDGKSFFEELNRRAP